MDQQNSNLSDMERNRDENIQQQVRQRQLNKQQQNDGQNRPRPVHPIARNTDTQSPQGTQSTVSSVSTNPQAQRIRRQPQQRESQKTDIRKQPEQNQRNSRQQQIQVHQQGIQRQSQQQLNQQQSQVPQGQQRTQRNSVGQQRQQQAQQRQSAPAQQLRQQHPRQNSVIPEISDDEHAAVSSNPVKRTAQHSSVPNQNPRTRQPQQDGQYDNTKSVYSGFYPSTGSPSAVDNNVYAGSSDSTEQNIYEDIEGTADAERNRQRQIRQVDQQIKATKKKTPFIKKVGRVVKNALHEPMLIISIVIILFVLLFMRAFLVPSGSMLPTLKEGDRIFSLARYFPNGETYQPGDIVCFTSPSGDTYVKRVVAKGGDVVEITGDTLYVNGEESPYQGTGTGAVAGTWELADDEYFVMGDNRSNSADSRYIGPVKADKMISKVYAIYFPFDHLKWLG